MNTFITFTTTVTLPAPSDEQILAYIQSKPDLYRRSDGIVRGGVYAVDTGKHIFDDHPYTLSKYAYTSGKKIEALAAYEARAALDVYNDIMGCVSPVLLLNDEAIDGLLEHDEPTRISTPYLCECVLTTFDGIECRRCGGLMF